MRILKELRWRVFRHGDGREETERSPAVRNPLSEDGPPGGLGSVATTGVIFGDFGSVAMIGLSRRFFGCVARKGVREKGIGNRGQARKEIGRSARMGGDNHKEW